MNKTLIALLALWPLAAAANPFPKGDPKVGKKLHDAKCVACHQRLVGGSGSDIYTRIDRKIQTPKALQQRIAACNAQVNAGWFPEEEEHAAAHLNQQFYKFK
ncbi:MAG: cytochrome c [Rhodocyclales bacterium]|nr:cytochrome c [Rhodocyclales bacterium]